MGRPDEPVRLERGARLGPFELIEWIGVGGMGHVFRAVHVSEGTPAAVKLLVHLDAEHTAAFRHEVRAVAALDHPNVIQLLDAGEVDEAASAVLGRTAVVGAPWLAMEFAEEGSVSRFRGKLGWPDLRLLLGELLDALAHAHARGVFHRDLKPGNVLRGGLRPGVKLSDFGIAHLRGPRTEERATPLGGTPSYMAPEQVQGRWRDYGPWTDLYALGCTAWTLATGAPPFKEKGFAECARAHLTRPPPEFVPRRAVPAGFEDWLRRLLAKDPSDRFRRAADASWALEALGDAGGEEPWRTPEPAPHRSTLAGSERSSSELVTPAWLEVEPPAGQERPPAGRPPLPGRWERGQAVPRRRATLALFGLRQVRVVGRRAERDALWSALRGAVAGRPRAVVLSGAAGCGKSRLAEWLCERAHELGAAEVLVALHASTPGHGHGLVPMLARALRCAGLSRAELAGRLGKVLPGLGLAGAEDVDAVAELLSPATDEERRAGIRALRLSDGERAVLAQRLVTGIAAERPVVLWADDLQWGAETAELLLTLVDLPLPLLVVATVHEEALGDDALATERVRTLAAHPAATAIAVRPLGRHATRELLHTGLGLEEGLARSIEPRVGGNPLFALQLVGDWVARQQLRATPAGLALREGAELAVPEDVSSVWRARLDRACEGSAVARTALALAACLGLEVDPALWQAAARHAGARVPPDLVERLLDQRLWRPALSGPGYVFAHARLRDQALDGVALEPLHRACAEALAGVSGPGVAARLGRHRLRGGQAWQAIGPLVQAAGRAASAGDLREADELVALALQALDASGAPSDDPRRAPCLARQAELARARGDLDRARRAAEALLDAPDARGWAAARLRARAVLAFLALKAHDLDGAASDLADVVDGLERLGEGPIATRVRVLLAIAHQYRGDLRAASEVIAVATDRSRELDDSAASGEAHRVRGAIALQLGRLDEASEHYEAARATFDEGGHRSGRCLAEAGLGDAARFSGRLDEAEHWYLRSVEGLEACGAVGAVSVRASLALVRMERGEWAEARAALEVGARQLERRGALLEARGLFRFLALPCHAALGDWPAFDAVVGASGVPVVDADVVRALDRAAALAEEQGQPARAARARALADRQRRMLAGRG